MLDLKPTFLANRLVLAIQGDDPVGFLQGLMTQDLRLLRDPGVLYGLFLSQRGRYFCDAFIFQLNGIIYLDVPADAAPPLLSRLNLYRMRRQLTIEMTGIGVVVSPDQLAPGDHHIFLGFPDPRFKDTKNPIGWRYLVNNPQEFLGDFLPYHHMCIALGLPSHGFELMTEKTIPAEAHMDQLNAVSYDKGCYVGQELTSRTHYVGEVRRAYMPFRLEGSRPLTAELTKDSEVTDTSLAVLLDGESIGTVTSLSPHGGIARVNLEALEKANPSGLSCTLMEHNVTFFKPAFL